MMPLELIGKKLRMTTLPNEDGTRTPVTLIELYPLVVTQVKTPETDGYWALQVGWGHVKGHRLPKPELGHQRGIEGLPFKHLAEFRLDTAADYQVGDILPWDIVSRGAKVKVSGTSKGRGFTGVMKRHGFHGATSSHGTSKVHRKPQSSGATDAARVFKGTKKPGRYGNRRASALNLEVVDLDGDSGLLVLKGSVPGASGGTVRVALWGK
jgi:large subunit ribosomal protein L3